VLQQHRLPTSDLNVPDTKSACIMNMIKDGPL
jgi:hypothetical protein